MPPRRSRGPPRELPPATIYRASSAARPKAGGRGPTGSPPILLASEVAEPPPFATGLPNRTEQSPTDTSPATAPVLHPTWAEGLRHRFPLTWLAAPFDVPFPGAAMPCDAH